MSSRAEPRDTQQRWEDYFDPNERLLWEDAPVSGIHIGPGAIFLSLFGMPFLLAGLGTLIAGLSQMLNLNFADADGALGIYLIFFSLPFVTFGGIMVFGPWVKGPIAARRVRYALSNRRAYIAKSYWRRTMDVYVIKPDDPVELEQGRRADTVTFGRENSRDSDGNSKTTMIGFENISDGARVYKLIRKIQKDLQ